MSKVIVKTLFAVMISTTAIAKAFSYYTGWSLLLCMVPLLPLLGIVTIRFVRKYCYRPQENHLGVVYRFGRFHRFVEPDEWAFLFPYIEELHREVSLYMRTAEVNLSKVELQDGLTVDVRFKVFFKTDPRLARQESLIQALKFEGPEWPEMIKTGMEDITRNQIFLDIDHTKMNMFRKSREIKRIISKEISDRMRGFGVLINEEYGAMLVEARPNETYVEAVQKYKAAVPMGQAALERLRPVLDALKHMRHEDARAAMLLEYASKIIEVENLPDLVLSPLEEYAGSAPVVGENRRNIEAYKKQRRNPLDLPLAN
jgi:regulator of protease activity HflC (stomatin/prohibitin superfamily)